MAFLTGICLNTLNEPKRRKAGASGVPVQLSNGQHWLLSAPTYHPRKQSLTSPCVDSWLDRFFDLNVEGDQPTLEEIWEVAWILLTANYDLTDDELAELLTVSSPVDCDRLTSAVLEAVFGPDVRTQNYTDWVRATLLANSASGPLNARDLSLVLAVLVGTDRAVPMTEFISSCRALEENQSLEVLV